VNSLVAAGVSTLIAVALGTVAGYGLARSSFRGKDHVAFWIISTRMAPIAAAVLPLFVIFRATHLLGTTTGLVVAYLSFNLPFAIWLMNAFFADLPPALEEAAMIDGASRWTAFRRIALPLVLPGVATTAILCLVFSWNDYAFASTFSGPDSQTLPIAASQLVTQTEIDWGQLTAIGTIVVAPMIVVGLVVRRWLVTGLTLGAVTGE
jgi:multiple sugar transport system permease protein